MSSNNTMDNKIIDTRYNLRIAKAIREHIIYILASAVFIGFVSLFFSVEYAFGFCILFLCIHFLMLMDNIKESSSIKNNIRNSSHGELIESLEMLRENNESKNYFIKRIVSLMVMTLSVNSNINITIFWSVFILLVFTFKLIQQVRSIPKIEEELNALIIKSYKIKDVQDIGYVYEIRQILESGTNEQKEELQTQLIT